MCHHSLSAELKTFVFASTVDFKKLLLGKSLSNKTPELRTKDLALPKSCNREKLWQMGFVLLLLQVSSKKARHCLL